MDSFVTASLGGKQHASMANPRNSGNNGIVQGPLKTEELT